MTDTDLDRLLAGARAAPMAPSEALMARVLADAQAHQPRPLAPASVPAGADAAARHPRSPRRGLWSALSAEFGGAGVLAGLGAAAALGLVLGYVNPAGLGALADGFLPLSAPGLELVPVTDILFTEG